LTYIKSLFLTLLQDQSYLWVIDSKVTSSRPVYYSILNSLDQRSQYISKVHIFWEGHKILRNLPLTFDCSTYVIQSKVRGRFRNILWPSQNIWTLFNFPFINSLKMLWCATKRDSLLLATFQCWYFGQVDSF
jgi:hypothetical protein